MTFNTESTVLLSPPWVYRYSSEEGAAGEEAPCTTRYISSLVTDAHPEDGVPSISTLVERAAKTGDTGSILLEELPSLAKFVIDPSNLRGRLVATDEALSWAYHSDATAQGLIGKFVSEELQQESVDLLHCFCAIDERRERPESICLEPLLRRVFEIEICHPATDPSGSFRPGLTNEECDSFISSFPQAHQIIDIFRLGRLLTFEAKNVIYKIHHQFGNLSLNGELFLADSTVPVNQLTSHEANVLMNLIDGRRYFNNMVERLLENYHFTINNRITQAINGELSSTATVGSDAPLPDKDAPLDGFTFMSDLQLYGVVTPQVHKL